MARRRRVGLPLQTISTWLVFEHGFWLRLGVDAREGDVCVELVPDVDGG